MRCIMCGRSDITVRPDADGKLCASCHREKMIDDIMIGSRQVSAGHTIACAATMAQCKPCNCNKGGKYVDHNTK